MTQEEHDRYAHLCERCELPTDYGGGTMWTCRPCGRSLLLMVEYPNAHPWSLTEEVRTVKALPTESTWLKAVINRALRDMAVEYTKESVADLAEVGYELIAVHGTFRTMGSLCYGLAFPFDVRDRETGERDTLVLAVDLHNGRAWVCNDPSGDRVSPLYSIAIGDRP